MQQREEKNNMSGESKKNGFTSKDIIELVINAVIALAALITAIKS